MTPRRPVDLSAVRAADARLAALVAAHPELRARAAAAAAWLATGALESVTPATTTGDTAAMPTPPREDRSTIATAVVTLRLTADEAAALGERVDAARAALPDGATLTQSAYVRALIRAALGLAPVGGASVAPVAPLAPAPRPRARSRVATGTATGTRPRRAR